MEASALIQGKRRSQVEADRVLTLALLRLLEMLGEAANRVSPAVRNEHPEIAWLPMIGLRNRLIHGYDAVDLDILWRSLESDVPSLIPRLEALLQSN